MIRINLQSAGQKKQKRRAASADADAGGGGGPSSFLPAMMLVLPIASGAGGSYYVHASLTSQIEETNEAIRRGEAELARLKPILDEIERFKKDQALLQNKLAAIRSLQSARTGPVQLYAELAALMPPQVWVTAVRETGGAAQIEGFGLDSQSIAVFVNSMGRSRYFANVELTIVEQATYLGLDIKKFNVVCRFQVSGASPAAVPAAAPGGQPVARGK